MSSRDFDSVLPKARCSVRSTSATALPSSDMMPKLGSAATSMSIAWVT
jgi:hypothetical protein